MKISILGSGFVGNIAGRGFKNLNHDVIFYDIDEKTIKELKEEHITTTDLEWAVENTMISFVCVPTPFIHSFESKRLINLITEVAELLKEKDEYHLVVVKSTVLPTTTERVLIPILNKHKNLGEMVGLCVNPEFGTEIADTWTDEEEYTRGFLTEDHIVIGEYDKKSGDILTKLYEKLDIPIFRMDIRTAEMVKYVSNCMLATKISYWNEIFLLCNELDIDSQKIADVLSRDQRIGKYGTVHGKAFGGKCLPKDLKALIDFAEDIRSVRLLKAVDGINEEMKKKFGVRE